METNSKVAPSLRSDIKVTRQVLSEKVSFVVKDPLKNQYFRFAEEEWGIISLFDGKRSLEQIRKDYNQGHEDEIDIDTLKDYQKNLEELQLFIRSGRDMNLLLLENMRETRKSQLLSKKGSLMYKRFPIVDPDKFFDRIIGRVAFFWTKGFLILSAACMMLFAFIVASRWSEFQNGLFEVFQFSQMSFWNLVFLWITIYAVIAIHELGHGLTCKFYGGEVHEIGFLLLFFQPCLYCNVNDAWLFDKKWKQVMVTLAGGYIEFWIGSLFAIVWAITNPNTIMNVLSFQVMTICSISTIFCNFNPLVKLDGYYLLADFLEAPNLRDNSFDYVKYLTSKYVFRMSVPDSDTTPREKKVYFFYGLLSAIWVTSTMLGLFALAKGLLIDSFYSIGVLVSLWVAYKLFWGYVIKIKGFMMNWAVAKSSFLRSRNGKLTLGGISVALIGLLLLPVPYSINGICSLDAGDTRILRAAHQGIISSFAATDGSELKPNQAIALLTSSTIEFDKGIVMFAVQKLQIKQNSALKENLPSQMGTSRELASKTEEFNKIKEKVESLAITYSDPYEGLAVLSCPNQVQRLNTFVQEGDEVCRIHSLKVLKALVEIPEQQVGFIQVGNPVEFKLHSEPFMTYDGKIIHLRSMSKNDPVNPKAKLYIAEIHIDNPGDLRAGMSGVARIEADRVYLAQYMGRKFSSFFRMDLFL